MASPKHAVLFLAPQILLMFHSVMTTALELLKRDWQNNAGTLVIHFLQITAAFLRSQKDTESYKS